MDERGARTEGNRVKMGGGVLRAVKITRKEKRL